MKLSIIIVNYNVRHFLEQALLSVRNASRGIAIEIWVVDNNSVDDSVAMVQEKFPEVQLIVNQDNPGFAKANNQAIRLATGEYVLLLNPDTIIEEDTLTKCIAFMDAHTKAGALGVRMIDGAGKFLPESKRGFPTPWVAFCKTFGLSKIFPRSANFNGYHLGHLDEHQTHQVDVLSGAFMFIRYSVLDEVGMLDETFFMYGEDIDLSYRITQTGYPNYYFPDTSIIHYKGESTKKGSLNYVRTFYKAMIIFARKHFQGRQAWGFIFMLQLAIYFRASLSLLARFLKAAYLPILDAGLIFGGLLLLKDFWATYHFRDPGYYDQTIVYFNFPLYTLTWIAAIFFNGGYDRTGRLRHLIRGLLFGTLILAAIYGFLALNYRSSRALIVLGTIWALGATIGLRFLLHFIRFGNLHVDRDAIARLIIVGSKEESERVRQLLQQLDVQKKIMGTVAPQQEANEDNYYISNQYQLDEVVEVYKINELIFCSRDIPAERIMHWMSKLGPRIAYKTVVEEGLSIIGSQSKDSMGELYTVAIYFAIDKAANRRNKRLLDLSLSFLVLLFSPILLFLFSRLRTRLAFIWQIFLGNRTWVGYVPTDETPPLPSLIPGLFSPVDALKTRSLKQASIQKLNFFYAKDYHPSTDLEIIWKALFIKKTVST